MLKKSIAILTIGHLRLMALQNRKDAQITHLVTKTQLFGNIINMEKLFIIIFVFFFLFQLTRSLVFASSNQSSIDKGLLYLRSQQRIDGHIDGFSGVTDWASMAFSGNNIDITAVATQSGQSIEQNLAVNPPSSTSASTEWARKILAVTAAGQNPYDFNGINLVSGLESYYSSNQIGNTAADNDDIFGLLALLASKVDSENKIIADATSFIINHQHTDGGFSYSTDKTAGSDIDDTAAAIMTLQAAKSAGVNNANLQVAIDTAKAYILIHQNTDGGFAYDPNPNTSWDTTSNISTTSWVVMSLSALSMGTDNHFITAQKYLLSSQQSDGSFPYQPSSPPGDTFDTAYVLTALENVFWPIHIFSGTVPTDSPTPTAFQADTPSISPSQIVIVATATPTSTSTQPQPVDPTSTPTSTSTPPVTLPFTPTPIAVVQNQLFRTIEPSVLPSSTPKPEPTTAVLGIQTKSDKSNRQSTKLPVISIVFLVLGSGFLIFHFEKIHQLHKKEACHRNDHN